MSPPQPVAITPCLPAELLSYILQQTYPATLIICGSREAFLSSLLTGTSLSPAQPPIQQDVAEFESSMPPSSSESHESNTSNPQPEPQPHSQPQVRHPLLRATLHQISLSRKITLAFTSTVSHLRAYLSVFPTTSSAAVTPPTQTRPISAGSHGLRGAAIVDPLLVIYGLVTLHSGTSEWSTQGLSVTCAAAVEAGRRCARRVVLVEPLREQAAEQEEKGEGEGEEVEGSGEAGGAAVSGGGGDLTDGGDSGETDDDDDEGSLDRERELGERHLQGIWHEKLPILSGSVRRAGLVGLEYGGRTVEVGMVLRRWFMFERGGWEGNDHV